MDHSKAKQFLESKYRSLHVDTPYIHVVLGSALGNSLDEAFGEVGKKHLWGKVAEFPFSEMPGLPITTVAGHKGNFVIYKNTQTQRVALFQSGRVHGYEGHSPQLTITPVMASRLAGTMNFLLTNASGSLNHQLTPCSTMVLSDHVNLTGKNPLIGENPKGPDGRDLGPRFPDMSEVYCQNSRKLLLECLHRENIPAREGVYLGLLGPTYETPAEVRLFAKWGLDAVGMSTVWEAIGLKHSGARVSGVALITNYACGLMGAEELKHEELLLTTKKSALAVLRAVACFIEK